MTITPTLFTAALAGAFSAIALPLLRQWMGDESGVSIPLIIAMVLTVAFPAKTFVIGPEMGQKSSSGSIDTAVLKRVGVWMLAAALVSGLWAVA